MDRREVVTLLGTWVNRIEHDGAHAARGYARAPSIAFAALSCMSGNTDW
jgi:hypothetical protein